MVADVSLAVLLREDDPPHRDPTTVEFLDAFGRPIGHVQTLDWRAEGYRVAVPFGARYVELVADPCPDV